jgi:SAM-dependent methyltransferase
MNPGEHETMARVEARHWWYRGLRDALFQLLERPQFRLRDAPRVLDAGCGTGQNLRCLEDRLQPSYLGGFDLSEEAVQFASEKTARADVYRSDICDPEIRERELDLVVSMDVIYIPGARRSMPGLKRIVEALRPGGLFVLNLPAYDWLYSEHDVAIHTSERYTLSRVRSILSELDLSVERISYRLCFLFPLVVGARLPSLLRPKRDLDSARSDLHSEPRAWVNRSFVPVLRLENACIARGFRFPFGSSIFAVGRKR